MAQKQSMTPEQAVKTIDHIQKVFYIVGGFNALFAFVVASSTVFSFGLLSGALIGMTIVFMGWSLTKSYKYYIPNAALILGVFLLALNIVGNVYGKSTSLLGLIFPFALWIIGKQAKQALNILKTKE